MSPNSPWARLLESKSKVEEHTYSLIRKLSNLLFAPPHWVVPSRCTSSSFLHTSSRVASWFQFVTNTTSWQRFLIMKTRIPCIIYYIYFTLNRTIDYKNSLTKCWMGKSFKVVKPKSLIIQAHTTFRLITQH